MGDENACGQSSQVLPTEIDLNRGIRMQRKGHIADGAEVMAHGATMQFRACTDRTRFTLGQ